MTRFYQKWSSLIHVNYFYAKTKRLFGSINFTYKSIAKCCSLFTRNSSKKLNKHTSDFCFFTTNKNGVRKRKNKSWKACIVM